MADKPRMRKNETVRQRSTKLAEKSKSKKSEPKNSLWANLFKKIFTPLRFLAWPFKLRPVKFIFRWVGRILWPKYFRNSFHEIRQVKWPNRKDTWKMTFAVIIFAVVFGALAHLTDYGFDKLIKRIVFR